MPLMTRLARLMVGVGIGILTLSIAAWPVNVLVYDRAAWFYRNIAAFLECGSVSLLLGISLMKLFHRRRKPTSH
jgi:presenilin-like A22 family membrane protease